MSLTTEGHIYLYMNTNIAIANYLTLSMVNSQAVDQHVHQLVAKKFMPIMTAKKAPL
jgi:hypothetical protein